MYKSMFNEKKLILRKQTQNFFDKNTQTKFLI